MIETINIIDDCQGLNTILDPFQPVSTVGSDRKAQRFLTKAVNVRITDSKKIERSEPTTHLFDLTDGHSLFCDGGSCLVHDSGSMYEIATNLTLSSAKRSSMSGDQISHTQAGDAIYFSNLSENGVYYGNTVISWAVDPYIGPETNRYFETTVPYFSHIAYFNGYMLGAIGNALFVSELGLLGLWEMKPIWMSNSDLIMVRPVEGGVFISDRTKQFYLNGIEPNKFTERKIANYPAFEWSDSCSLVDAARFTDSSGLAATWFSSKGQCVGFADGTFKNITIDKIIMPTTGTLGASLVIGHNLISTLR